MGKKDRLDKIKEIIVSFNISSQDELLNVLKSSGFDLTQATLSRDLKQLKVAKIPTVSGYRYSLSSKVVDYGRAKSNSKTSSRLPGGIVSIDFSGAMGVIKTSPGFASALAWSIDNYADSHILGTIAGDDTIFLALNEKSSRRDVMALLTELFPEIKSERLV
jgi:transcriptional regulator of arginine metabolism